MKTKAAILAFLFLFSLVPSRIFLAGADFGESSTSLGQFTDEFTDLNSTSVLHEVRRNSTYNAMELNKSGFQASWIAVSWNETFEDFPTGWTVLTGGGGTITKSSAQEHGGSWSARIYAPASASYCYGYRGLSALNADSLAVFYLWVDPSVQPDYEHVVGLYDTVGGAYAWRITLDYHDSGYWIQNDVDVIGTDVAEIEASEWVEIIIYFNDTSNQVRYIINGIDEGLFTAQNGAMNGNRVYIGDLSGGMWKGYYYLDDLIIGTGSIDEAYALNGYFITTDYLSDPLANGSALVHLTNTTIPEGTGILIEYSDDNSTWVFNDWQPIFGGFESVDLRDLNYSAGFYIRYNYSTADPAITPRLYQSRLISTIGEVGPAPPAQNVTGEWVEYRASAINASVGVVDGGDLNSTFEIDGDTFNVSEVVGAPGMLISINFTGIDPDAECVWISIWYLYDGNLNHVFEIEMWNFTSSSWVTDGLLVDTAAFEWKNSTIYELRIPNEFLSGGEVRVQLNHETPGNINHDLFIEYIRLITEIPSDVVPTEPFQFVWIVIAIALMIIGIVLARMWPHDGDP